MKKCWREVNHIDISTGEAGGRIWVLKLECGHTVFRYIPKIRLHTLTAFKRREPPHRCHCVCCAEETEERNDFHDE